MPGKNKIALLGFGINSVILTAGAACISVTQGKTNNNSDSNISIQNIAKHSNNKTLVDSYRKVQQKYYPEKDVFKIMK